MQCDGFHQPHRTPRIRPADSKAAVPWAKVRAAPSRVRCGTRTRGCTAASRRPAPSCWRRRSRCAPARTTPGTGRGDPRRARRPRARSARAPGYPSSPFQLDSKFGTVRCYPTSVLPANLTPARAGTVRVASRHSRPSVLPPHVAAASTVDPYDLVRRSRLTTAVSEGSGHFRARSASPAHKREPQNGQGAKVKGDHPVGRRSILECDINPYELVSPDASTAGITLVSGQRIRVRPTTTDVDVDFGDDRHAYEDVQLRLTPSAKASSKTTSKRPSSVPTTAKESRRESGAAGQRTEKSNVSPTKSRTKTYSLEDSNSDYFNNQFKSILKKSSIYDDVEANELTQTRSPSPVKRKGCQFYIPTPPSPGYGVKKKVQFLVDDEDLTESVSDEKSVVDKECSNEDDEVFEKVVECKEETQNEPQIADEKTTKRPPSLYRSLSDRMRKDESKISFNDTMALRYLKQRKNLQINFSDLDRLDGAIHRARKVSPRPRVPPPPPPPLPPSKEKEISSEAIKDTVEKPDETVSMEKLDRCINGDITVPSQTAPPPLAPPRKRSNNKPPAVNVTIPPATQRVQVESPTELHVNKTIVRISSPPAVHKLQIKTDYPETAPQVSIIENSQRKTSILINGNDCYSTVNVGDSAPIYQSSVVVMDCPTTTQQQQKKCSSIYITGEFTSPSQETETAPSSETLRELLRDPVEAVRRNLVPHVCGKSDVSRRPRDKKPLRSVKVLPEVRDASLEELSYDAAACDDLSSEHSSSTQYESMDAASDCYTDTSNRSSIAEEESTNRTKFYELLAESAAVEVTEGEDHLYECIKVGNDPIYEEIEIPPPLPSNPPPAVLVDDLNLDKEFTTRSIFEGASKYDILSYLVDAKERGIVQEDQPFAYNFAHHQHPAEEDVRTVSDSSEDSSLTISGALIDDKATFQKPAEIERNDSGVGSETSKSSLSKYRSKQELCFLCEDCEGSLESKIEGEALLCRKCLKKRSERKEIITEIVETEEKYGRDLQIVLEEFYQPMLVAGLLSPDQLSAIFLNVEELLENSQALAEKLRDAVEIASEQGDEDLLSVNTGRLFLEALPMLHAFETYCVRQGAASLLLAGLEKDKELLRIFLRVSQMENAMLRRMNLNSFLMVPVQRVTKYPLLLARLHKVTPPHLQDKLELQEAQHKIELHLSHMNSETKDVPSKLWRRIGSSAGRRSSAEVDLVNIKLRKIAVDVLEWNHEEARFALEGKLLFTQPTDSNWRRGRTIKLTPVNALLVVNGKPISSKTTDRPDENGLVFSRHGAREAALLLVRDKNGRYSLLREPLYLDRCVIAADPAWQSYFEVQELLGRDTFIFKAEDEDQTNIWYKQLQFFAQGMGAWRKRRNALANIMINGMGSRS